MSYPSSQLTEHVTPNLMHNKRQPRYSWEGPLQTSSPLPYDADYMADTKRLFVINMSSSVIYFGAAALVSYLFVAFFGFILWTTYSGDNIFKEIYIIWYIFYSCLAIGIFSTLLYYFVGHASYYIFDRINGTVLIPKGLCKKSYVVPFAQVQCYGAPYISQHGIKHYRTMLIIKVKRKWSFGTFREIPLQSDLTRESSEAHWSLICQFMNRQNFLPKAGITGDWISFFETNNATIEDLANGKIPDEAIDAFEARMEKIMEQRNRHAA